VSSWRDLSPIEAGHLFAFAAQSARSVEEERAVERARDSHRRAYDVGNWGEADRERERMEYLLARPRQETFLTVLPVPSANDEDEAAE
jgi:hypothetical protein